MSFSNGFYYSANDFYRSLFGKKVYKIALSSGCTCPNRDGSKAYGGCIFCSSAGSGDFIQSQNESIEMQLEKGREFISSKIKDGVIIAYFQSYTNTYAKPEYLKKIYLQALSFPGVVGLAIGTRPDCLDEKIIELLSELSKNHFIQLELGLQTVKESSVKYINRCYENCEYEKAVKILKERCPKIHVVTHLIFGLPGEREGDMLSSLDYAVKAGSDGIKISLLHVLKGTRLLTDFENGKFKSMEMEEYFSVIGKAISNTPQNVVIHRLTGDGPKKILISPLWTADKKKVLNSMTRYFRENQIFQGKNLLAKF